MTAVVAPVPASPPDTTLAKGLRVLEFTAERRNTTPAEISRELGLSRSATYRLVERLVASGWLAEATGGGLRLGSRALLLGAAGMGQTDLVQLAPPLLRMLATSAGDTVNLAVPDGDFMTYVAQEEGSEAVRVTARLGTRRPMNCSALGKAYLSTLSDAERDERLANMSYVALTDRSLTDAASLRAEVIRTRLRGYAIDDAEVEQGVSCFAAPVYDFRGTSVAAISVAGPTERVRSREADISAAVQACARNLSLELGFLP